MDNMFRLDFMTLIGRPNVGKSTLMGYLIGQKIAIASDRPQATRNRIQMVCMDERGQIIFLDISRIHKAKNKLGEHMANMAEHIMSEVDVILWLVEPTTFIGTGGRHIVEQPQKVKAPVMLVINKVDMAKIQSEILKFIDAYKDICNSAEIVPVSVLEGENTELVTELIFKYLPEGPQFYDGDIVTDQFIRQIAAELIREEVLRLLNDEILHGIAVTVEETTERKNEMTDIEADIICERGSHKGAVIGKGGAVLKKIGAVARVEIEDLMDTKVSLRLWVKVRKEWRDSELYMKNCGCNPKE